MIDIFLFLLKATMLGLYLWGFLIPPVDLIPFFNILETMNFLGCFPPFLGAWGISFLGG